MVVMEPMPVIVVDFFRCLVFWIELTKTSVVGEDHNQPKTTLESTPGD